MGTGPTILICDDEASIRQLVAMKLRSAGFEVVDARNGLEGYCCCDPSALPPGATPRVPAPIVPALVVTDLQMPIMSGIEMAVKLRAFAPTSRVPVLMLTARGYILNQDEVAQSNIRSVMGKPFAGQQLLDKVRAMLSESASQAA
jgi:DNA-binding response OmpR family regulator